MPRPRIDDDRGASAVEYGLIVFAIAAVIALAVFFFGARVAGLFGDSCDHIADKTATASSCG